MNIQFYGAGRNQFSGMGKNPSAVAKSRVLAKMEAMERTRPKPGVAVLPKDKHIVMDFPIPDDGKHTWDKRFYSDFFDNYYELETNAPPGGKFQKIDVTDLSNVEIDKETGEKTYLSKEEHAAAIEQAKVNFKKQQLEASYNNIHENMLNALQGTAKQGASWKDFDGAATSHLYADQRIEDVAVMYAYFQNRIEQDGGDIADLDRALKDVIGKVYGNGFHDIINNLDYSKKMSEESYELLTSSIYKNVVNAAKDYKDIEIGTELNPTDFMFQVRGDGSVHEREPLEGVLTTEDLKLFAALKSSDFAAPTHDNEELLGISLAMSKIMYMAAGEKASDTGKAFFDDVFQQVMDAKMSRTKKGINSMVGASFTGGLLYDPLDEKAVMNSMNKMLSSYESGNFQHAVAKNYESVLNTLNSKMELQYESGKIQARYATNYLPNGREPMNTKEYNRFMEFIGNEKYSIIGGLNKVDVRV